MAKCRVVLFALLVCLFLSSCGNSKTPVTETAAPSQQPGGASSPEQSATPTPAPKYAIAADRQDAIYNPSHVQAAYLRMKKAEIESVYKPSEQNEAGFVSYDGGGFFIKYYDNDTVKELVLFEKSSWMTYNGVSVGSTVTELTSAYGEPISAEDGVYLYYSLDNELLKEAPSLAEVDLNYLYTLSFIVEDDVVSSVAISRF